MYTVHRLTHLVLIQIYVFFNHLIGEDKIMISCIKYVLSKIIRSMVIIFFGSGPNGPV